MGAAILWRNLADAAVVRATSSLISTPPSLVARDPHTRVRWQSLSGSASLWFDLGGLHQLDTFGLVGAQGATARWRFSADDPYALDGGAHDGAVLAIDQTTGQTLHATAEPLTARYGRADLVGASHVAAGRLVVGKRWAPEATIDFGMVDGFLDGSVRSVATGQQIHVDAAPERLRTIEATFSWLTEAEAKGEVRAIDRENGLAKDILFIPDDSSPDIARDAVWGLMAALQGSPVRKGRFWTKTYRTEERA